MARRPQLAPKLFAFDHLPEEPAWQLVDAPLGAGDFARQPLISSYIGVLGMALEQPTRSHRGGGGDVAPIFAIFRP